MAERNPLSDAGLDRHPLPCTKRVKLLRGLHLRALPIRMHRYFHAKLRHLFDRVSRRRTLRARQSLIVVVIVAVVVE